MLTKGAIIKELAGPRHYTEMTRREFSHAPQALPWKTGRNVVYLIDPAPSPLGGWRGRVELVVELVVDFDVSCCLLDHFVSDPCGTEAVIINQCSSRNRKVCTSSFWEPQLSQGHQSRSITFESNHRGKSSRKGINNMCSKWRILYCDSRFLPRSRCCQGRPRFSVDSLFVTPMLGKSDIISDWGQARMCWGLRWSRPIWNCSGDA